MSFVLLTSQDTAERKLGPKDLVFFWLNSISNIAEVGLKDTTQNNSNQGCAASRHL